MKGKGGKEWGEAIPREWERYRRRGYWTVGAFPTPDGVVLAWRRQYDGALAILRPVTVNDLVLACLVGELTTRRELETLVPPPAPPAFGIWGEAYL